jgi:hypothetical protein
VLVSRKNNEAYSLDVTEDIFDAIRWHIRQGYAGSEFLFSQDGTFPRYIDSYKRPMVTVQRALGLRPLSHHALGRHSVASQAVTSGHSIKAVQAQLGHRSEQSTHVYAHLGSRAQLRLVQGLQAAAAPHGTLRAPSKRKAPSVFARCQTSLVAGAGYAQRCPVEFGLPMEVLIAA